MDVVLPGSVQRQLDQAAEIEAQAYGQPAALDTENTVETPEPAVPAPQAEQPTAPVTQKVVTDEVWEQKFNVLRGKYEAEVPRLHAQIRELNDQIQALAQRQEQQVAPEAKAPVSTADDEAFGADLMEAVRRASREEVTKATKEIDKKLDSAVRPVAEKQVQSDTSRFWAEVDAKEPDFTMINADPRWFQYLDTRIPGTRMTYRSAAQMAVDKFDSASLVELVQNWKQAYPVAVNPPPVIDTTARDELSKQVAPTTRKDSAPTSPQGRIWTGAEYEAAQDPRNANRMPKAEYQALVADSELALAEGRIKW